MPAHRISTIFVASRPSAVTRSFHELDPSGLPASDTPTPSRSRTDYIEFCAATPSVRPLLPCRIRMQLADTAARKPWSATGLLSAGAGQAALRPDSPLGPDGPSPTMCIVTATAPRHGLLGRDARAAYAVAIGAVRRRAGTDVTSDEHGEVIVAAIRTLATHPLDRAAQLLYRLFLRGSWRSTALPPEGTGLKYVDHCVGNVELGKMNEWVAFYERVLGFTNILTFDDKQISTEYSALMSKVMSNGNGRIKFPINEPAIGKRKSQIDEYLDFYHGPGVQHVAIATKDIVKTVTEIQKRGVEFLRIPGTYYETGSIASAPSMKTSPARGAGHT